MDQGEVLPPITIFPDLPLILNLVLSGLGKQLSWFGTTTNSGYSSIFTKL